MALLSDHVNVYSPCIALLDLQGWKIAMEPGPYEEEDARLDVFIAVRNGTTIRAEDPLRLLGLAAIDQHHQPHEEEAYWWSIKSDLYNQLEAEALERSFFIYQKKFPDACKKLIIEAIKEGKNSASAAPHDILGISLASFQRILEEDPDLKN
ncbi:MAG: hypothetical protein ACRBFS_15810 [Aureispira sp.]